MTMHGSATALEETPHTSDTQTHATETHAPETNTTATMIRDALRRRAQLVINDDGIDPRWRAVVRYALETNDPWLADLVRRADDDEPIIDTVDFSLEPMTDEDDSSEAKIELLTRMICQSSESAAAALFVLMGTLENSTHPKLLANVAKHFAFAHCADSNVFGIVDAQIAVVERELLASTT